MYSTYDLIDGGRKGKISEFCCVLSVVCVVERESE